MTGPALADGADVPAGAGAVTTKTCTKCGELKPLDEFRADRRARDGRGSCCRPCAAKVQRERYERPEVQQQQREYRRRPEVREQTRKRNALYRTTEAGRAANLAAAARYRASEGGKAVTRAGWARYATSPAGRARDRRKRAGRLQLLELVVQVPYRDEEIHARDGGRCWACGTVIALDAVTARGYRAWTVDHLVPIAHGGADAPYNLATACWSCNSSKNSRDAYSWAGERELELPDQLCVEAWQELRGWDFEDFDDSEDY